MRVGVRRVRIRRFNLDAFIAAGASARGSPPSEVRIADPT
ncbi:MAG: hypothetical protein JO168_26210 [Solirubrobacterales bacterium]|nr:hypothetical protein [Solirubrobacterales bacterium]